MQRAEILLLGLPTIRFVWKEVRDAICVKTRGSAAGQVRTVRYVRACVSVVLSMGLSSQVNGSCFIMSWVGTARPFSFS